MRKMTNTIWIACLAIWIAMTAWIITIYPDLPDTIATRHNSQGIPTEFHDKSILWGMLFPVVIITGILYSLTFLNINNTNQRIRENNNLHLFIATIALLVNILIFWGMTNCS